ncbi:MarR family winged helix-turn-helix transcriptional regulator [Mycobacterium sp. NPDC050041]|uniref:MarR family winged helix-turn-helix transcriptional regulator n=1 Tax=Mycobacterium sp. NPDC050041 TaxID=3364293 RepID=UPI003C2FB3D9
MADDTVQWLDDREMTAWRALVETVARLPTALDVQLQRDSDLSFLEYYVLAALSEAPDGTVGMSTLAVLTNAEQSRLSHLVTRLERQGLVGRERDRANGRHINAVITATGRARIEEAAPGHVANVRRLVFDALSATDVQTLSRACRRINEQVGPY